MKCAFLVLLLVACTEAATVSTAEGFARRWLRQHAPPQADELSELKGVNPEAYAIVKALLTKRSLGLLDPKHPSASFAAPPPQQQEVPDQQGPEAFKQFETPAEASKMAVYPEAAVSAAHHDWLHWKPQGSAMDDDAMVKNVLGAVAELKSGGKLRGGAPQQQEADPLAWQQPAPVMDMKPVPAQPEVAAMPEQPAPMMAPKASMSQENSYLKDIDFGLKVPVAPAVPAQENSYLKGVDLVSDSAPAAPVQPAQLAAVSTHQQQETNSYLSGFSFDDSAPAPAAKPAATTAAPAKAAPGNALLAWLGGSVKKAPAPKTAAIQTPSEPQSAMSKYLSDLQ